MSDQSLPVYAGRPSGDVEAWKQRYSPSIVEVKRFNEPPTPKVSVVLVAWRSAQDLPECLAHLREQRGIQRSDVEIVLVDNGGLESVHARIAELADVHVRMRHNVGLCPARNVGIAYARGAIASFVDDDGMVEPAYFANALRHFEDPKVVALRGRIFAKEHPYFSTVAVQYDRGDDILDDGLSTEGNCMVRSADLLDVGGFSEKLSPHEGVELSFQLLRRDQTLRILYAPDVVMHHDFCEDWRQFFRKSYLYPTTRELFADEGTEFKAFMNEYLSRKYPVGKRPFDQRLARSLLQAIRGTVQNLARLRSASSRRYIRQGS